MVRHIAANHGIILPARSRSGEIGGFIKSATAGHFHSLEGFEVFYRLARGEVHCQKARIRRDDQFGVQASFEAEFLNAVGFVLVVELTVKRVKAALRYSPGNALPVDLQVFCSAALAPKAKTKGFGIQAALLLGQKNRRHKILEHGARPGYGPGVPAGSGKGSAKRAPVFFGDRPRGDGVIAGHSCLTHQQIIIRRRIIIG